MKIKTITRDGKTYDVIPPRWDIVVVMIILLGCVTAILVWWLPKDAASQLRYLATIIVCIGILLNTCRCFLLSRGEFCCRLFGITYRKIPWKEIQQAGISSRKGKGGGIGGNGPFIMLTLKNCPRFQPGIENGATYFSNHPIRVIKIPYSKEIAKTLEKYYGPLDYDDTNPDLRYHSEC